MRGETFAGSCDGLGMSWSCPTHWEDLCSGGLENRGGVEGRRCEVEDCGLSESHGGGERGELLR